jgi:hypothetical protein
MTTFSDLIYSGKNTGNSQTDTRGCATLSKTFVVGGNSSSVQSTLPFNYRNVEARLLASTIGSASTGVSISIGNAADATHFCSMVASAGTVQQTSYAAASGASLISNGASLADKTIIVRASANDATFAGIVEITYARG